MTSARTLSKKFYPHCSVLVWSRNWFEFHSQTLIHWGKHV